MRWSFLWLVVASGAAVAAAREASPRRSASAERAEERVEERAVVTQYTPTHGAAHTAASLGGVPADPANPVEPATVLVVADPPDEEGAAEMDEHLYILDQVDRCPDSPLDRESSFDDDDGCPDPAPGEELTEASLSSIRDEPIPQIL